MVNRPAVAVAQPVNKSSLEVNLEAEVADLEYRLDQARSRLKECNQLEDKSMESAPFDHPQPDSHGTEPKSQVSALLSAP